MRLLQGKRMLLVLAAGILPMLLWMSVASVCKGTRSSVPEHTKYVTRNDEGTYTLTWTISAEKRDEMSLDRVMYRDIRIEDKLSEYAEMVDESVITVSAKDADGNRRDISDVAVEAEFNAETKTVICTFPENYVLPDGVTFYVRCLIEPSEQANKEAASGKISESSLHIGDPDTGDTAGIRGFYCSEKATLYYNGMEKAFSRPVIQAEVSDGFGE